MTTEKVFFSYSRKDSSFVLKLAKDLRDAGVELWLDQLDIRPGSHWDSSIQAALSKAHTLIVVLSPASVESENVMDEVSFALVNKKAVIPVLIGDCSPPFRLMRLQRIDFTGDYKTGLTHLLETLGQSSGSDVNTENRQQEEKQKLSDDAVKLITEKKDKELERLLWEKAKMDDSLPAYTQYIEEYPSGIYKADALNRIKRIEESGKPVETLKSKKYLFLAGGILIIALIIWGITQMTGNTKQDSKTEKSKITHDSISEAKQKKESDSIAAIAKKAEDDLRTKDSIKIGNIFRGGIIFYIDQTGKHGLIVAPFDQGKDIAWNNGDLTQTGAFGKEIYDGKENTETIVSKVGEGIYPAKLCANLVWKGYSDWYLPSKEELNELYNQSKAIGGFAKEYYWSSTEISNKDVFYRSFFNGHAYDDIKGNKAYVRAIRSF